MFRKLVLAIGLLVGASTAHADETTLQWLIQDISAAYGFNCRGNSCVEVWQNEIAALRGFVDYADQEGAYEFYFYETGEQAQRASDMICRTNASASYEWLVRITNAENRALPRLRRIQEVAGIPNVTTCTKYIR